MIRVDIVFSFLQHSSPIQFTNLFVPSPEVSPKSIINEIKIKSFHFLNPVSLQEVDSSDFSRASLSQTSDNSNNFSSSYKSTSQSPSSTTSFTGFSIPDTFEFMDIEDQQLYPGSKISCLSAIATLMSWFSTFPGLSEEAFSHLLYLLCTFILPQNNELPSSYFAAYSLVNHLLIHPQEFHAWVNDCKLFCNEYKDLQSCPKCGSSRYSDETQVPQKRLKYLPVFPRIKDMFALPKVLQLLQGFIQGVSLRCLSTLSNL